MTDQIYEQPITALVPQAPQLPMEPVTITTMMPARNKAPRRRNASPRKPAGHAHGGRYRNAATAPRAQTGGAARKAEPPATLGQKLKLVGTTVVGAVAASAAGVAATRLGFHPGWISTIVGGGGLVGTVVATNPLARAFWGGAMSAGGSQLALLQLQPTPSPPAPTPSAPQLSAPQHKNAELGTLPPGALDAAFERARAALAVDGYPQEHTGY